MSQTQVGNIIGVAVPAGKDINGGNDTDTGYGTANFLSINVIRARLNTISSTLFTTAVMDKMSYNDLMYALVVLGG
jgi:hypothetical protein